MKIILQFDENNITYTDGYLAAIWHAAQWNEAPAADPEACRAVELIGREIIRRWLAATPAELWHRQGTHAQTLPAIDAAANVRNVITAARDVVEQDNANPTSRHTPLLLAIDELEKCIAELDAKKL